MGDTVQLYDGTTALGSAVILSSADITAGFVDITTPALSNGSTYNLRAGITDGAGNVSTETATGTHNVTIDTTAPTATVAITAITTDSGSSSSDFITNDTSLTVSGTNTALGSGETVQVSNDGTTWHNVTQNTGTTWSYIDGTTHNTSFTYQARIVDAAGNIDLNTASQAVIIDTTAPNAPSITSVTDDVGIIQGALANNAVTDDTNLTVRVSLTGTGAASNDAVQLYNGTTALGSTATLSSTDIGNGYVDITTPTLSNGSTYNLRAAVIDVAGNTSGESTNNAHNVTIDTSAPTATVAITAITTDSGSSSSDFITNDTTLTVSGTNTALGSGETVQVSNDGGTTWNNVTQNTGTTWSYADPTTHNTSFTYQARIVDTAGNIDLNTDSQAVTIDTTAPTTSFAGITLSVAAASDSGVSNTDSLTNDTTPTITVSSLNGLAMSVNDVIQIIDTNHSNAVVGSYTVQASDLTAGLWNGTTKDITLSTLSAGTHTLDVRLGDLAGNTPAAASSPLSVTIDTTAPTLSASLPLDNASTAPLNRNIVLDFSEDVFANGGTITLTKDNSPGAGTIQTFTLTAGSTSGTGYTISGSTIVLNPTADLVSGGTYHITASATALVDAAGNAWAGISSTSTLNWTATTADATLPATPTITSVTDDVGSIQGTLANNAVTDDTQLVVRVSFTAGTGSSQTTTGALVGDTVQLYDGTTALGSAVILSSADITAGYVDITTPALSNGSTYNLRAGITDGAGNVSTETATGTHNVTIDTTAPTTSFAGITLSVAAASDSGVSHTDSLTNDTTPTITVSSLNGLAMSVNDVIQIIDTNHSNAVVGSYTVQASDLTAGLWNGTTKDITLSTLSAGTHTLDVRLGDLAGNTPAAASSPLSVTIDTTAPTLSASLPLDNASTAPLNRNIVLDFSEDVFANGGTITLTKDNSPGAGTIQTFTLTAGTTSGTGYTISGSTIVLNPTADLVSGGTYHITASATALVDAAGNAWAGISSTSTLNWTATAADATLPATPTITSVTDDVGSIQGTLANNAVTDDTQLVVRVSFTAGTGSSQTTTGALVGDTVQLYDGTTALGSAVILSSADITAGYVDITTPALSNGSTYNLRAGITDGAGNVSTETATGTHNVTIDTTAPTVATVVATGAGITNGNGILPVGSIVTLTVNLTEAVAVSGGTPTLTLNDGGTATYTGGSNSSALTFSYTVADGQTTPDLAISAVSLNGASIHDAAGNSTDLAGAVTNPQGTLQIGGLPSVSSVVATGAGITNGSGDLDAGHVVTLTINLTSAVTVTGGPTLTLNDGGTAVYTGGSSSTTALTFSYTVANGQNTNDLAIAAVVLNGATIQDGTGHNADLSGAVTNPAGTLQIDTTAPTVATTPQTNLVVNGGFETGDFSGWTLGGNSGVGPFGQQTWVDGGDPKSGQYAAGLGPYGSDGTLSEQLQTVAGQTYVVDFWLSNIGGNPNDFTATWGNTTLLALNNAPSTNYTEYTYSVTATGSSTNLEFDFRNDPTNWNLDNISVVPAQPSVVASGPHIDAAGNGAVHVGDTVTLTVNLDEPVTVTGGTPTLTLNDGGTANYTGGPDSTSALTFSYTVADGQTTPDLAVTAVNFNGASIQDAAGNTADLTAAVTNPAGKLQVGTPPEPQFTFLGTDFLDGSQIYSVTWNALGNQPFQVRVLNPTDPSTEYAHSFLYALPVEAGVNQTTYGAPLVTLEQINAQNTYNATIIEPIFPIDPWYSNSSTDPTVNYDTFMSTILPEWVDSNFATTGTEQNLMVGFSKSGYGALDLLFKHPDVFTAAAAWDFPGDMTSSADYGPAEAQNYGTNANFLNNYQLNGTFLDALKTPFTRGRSYRYFRG